MIDGTRKMGQHPLLPRLQKTLDHIISTDVECLRDLQCLSGKVLQIEFINTDLKLSLSICETSIIVGPSKQKPHVTLKATPGEFIQFILTNRQGSASTSQLEIVGELYVLQQFHKYLNRFSPDWESILSEVVGDTTTHYLSQFINRFKKSNTMDNLKLDITEYLRYETMLIPTPIELEEFYQTVDNLRNATDRLEIQLTTALDKEKN